MASGRTFFVQANLDELNALVVSLLNAKDMAAALQGLTLGANNGKCPLKAAQAFRDGWKVGNEWRERAEADRNKYALAGKASALARVNKYGTSQPSRTSLEHPSNDVRPPTPNEAPESPDSIHQPSSPQFGSNLQPLPVEQADGKPGVSILVSLPCSGGELFDIPTAELGKWRAAYPALDHLAEAHKMLLWLEMNPKELKPFSGVGKFITNWLLTAQNKLDARKAKA